MITWIFKFPNAEPIQLLQSCWVDVCGRTEQIDNLTSICETLKEVIILFIHSG